MITAMRSKAAKVVIYFFVVLLILGFIAWGVSDVLPTGGGNPQVAAKVGDVKISSDAVNQRYRDELNRLRSLLGNAIDAERAKALGLGRSILDGMVNDTLYNLGARDLGLTVTDEQIRRNIQNDQSFKNPVGVFDREQFQRILQANGFTESTYINELRRDMARDQLLGSLQAAAVVPKTLTDRIYGFREEQRLANFVRIEDSAFSDVDDPSDDVLENYYKDNANRFTAPEYRSISLATIHVDDIAKEVAVADDAIREFYTIHQDEYAVPERRAIKQILFADEKKARDAYTVLQTGRDFDTVAKEIANMDKAATDLGTVTKRSLSRDLSPAAAEAVFALEKGKVSKPVKSLLGWHVVMVTGIEQGSKKELDDVRDQIRKTLAREKALDSMFKLANKLEDTLAGGANLEEAASQLNLTLRKIPAVDRSGRDRNGELIKTLPKEGDFLETVFSLGQGQESQLRESGTDSYFIVRVDKVTPPALKPLADIRDEAVKDWKNEQRRTLARKKAQAILDQLKDAKLIGKVAEDNGLELHLTGAFTRTGQGMKDRLPPDLIEKLFTGLPGDAYMSRDRTGFVVAVLKDIKPVDPAAGAEERKAVSADLERAIGNDILVQLSKALRNTHSVTINKNAIDTLYQ
ncbi:MAG: SurA N-terminal domain-containing protein [Rhodospirillales bacterium]